MRREHRTAGFRGDVQILVNGVEVLEDEERLCRIRKDVKDDRRDSLLEVKEGRGSYVDASSPSANGHKTL
ncbi:hypothetical protein Gohar_020104, partial [Gossypium harknessii]|nr:hypothetical protein [Gossypium harknessii]